jgi:hypothetical protein
MLQRWFLGKMPYRQRPQPIGGAMLSLRIRGLRQYDTALTLTRLPPSLARMMRTRAAIGVLLAGVTLLGCRPDRPADIGIPDSTFVATLGELRRMETDTTLDPTMRDSTRRLILRRHKVTSTQLESAARELAEYPTRASDLWRRIESPPRVTPPKAPAVRPGSTTVQPLTNHPVPRP